MTPARASVRVRRGEPETTAGRVEPARPGAKLRKATARPIRVRGRLRRRRRRRRLVRSWRRNARAAANPGRPCANPSLPRGRRRLRLPPSRPRPRRLQPSKRRPPLSRRLLLLKCRRSPITGLLRPDLRLRSRLLRRTPRPQPQLPPLPSARAAPRCSRRGIVVPPRLRCAPHSRTLKR